MWKSNSKRALRTCKLLILNREKMDRLEQRDSLGTILYNFWPRYLTLVISASPMSLLILPPAASPLVPGGRRASTQVAARARIGSAKVGNSESIRSARHKSAPEELEGHTRSDESERSRRWRFCRRDCCGVHKPLRRASSHIQVLLCGLSFRLA